MILKIIKPKSGFTLVELLIILAVLVITATGGMVVWEKRTLPTPTPTSITESKPTVGGPVTPGFSEEARDLPTTAPTLITPFPEKSNKVQVILPKNIYQKDETITVSVKNNSSNQLGYYDCPGPKGGVVWFERKVDRVWEEEISLAGDDYGSRRPCYPRFLEAGQAFQKSRYISSEVPSGTYRACFHYVSDTVYSGEFKIL